MANNINWGKVYCDMATNDSWGADTYWSTNAVPDISAPECWDTFRLTADTTLFTADTNTLTADRTQL
jgi:hypothetical protein